MTKQQPIVQFQNVSMRYGTGPAIFRKVNFSLAPGSFHFLTGPSGAGKSSLIKLMHLAHRNYTGTVKVFEQDVKAIAPQDLPPYRQRIGIVFQDFFLLDHLSVIDNVALPLRVRGTSEKQSRSQAADILNWVGLSKYAKERPDTLSGGEQQRVALARAIIGKPKLLLADEPTGSVDDKMAVKLLYLFEELNAMGTTIILATHNRDLAGEFPHPELHLEQKNLTLIKKQNEEDFRATA